MLAALGAAAYWVVTRCPPDPRTWPEQAQADIARLRGHVSEAVAAGKRAAAARDKELLEELEGIG